MSSCRCQATVSVFHSPRQPRNNTLSTLLGPLTASPPSSLSDDGLASYFTVKVEASGKEIHRLTPLPTHPLASGPVCPAFSPAQTIVIHLMPPHPCTLDPSIPTYSRTWVHQLLSLQHQESLLFLFSYSHCHTKML